MANALLDECAASSRDVETGFETALGQEAQGRWGAGAGQNAKRRPSAPSAKIRAHNKRRRWDRGGMRKEVPGTGRRNDLAGNAGGVDI